MSVVFFQIMSLIIQAKVPNGKCSNETRAAQEKTALFLRFVRNIVNEVDLNIYMTGLYACDKIYNI